MARVTVGVAGAVAHLAQAKTVRGFWDRLSSEHVD